MNAVGLVPASFETLTTPPDFVAVTSDFNGGNPLLSAETNVFNPTQVNDPDEPDAFDDAQVLRCCLNCSRLSSICRTAHRRCSLGGHSEYGRGTESRMARTSRDFRSSDTYAQVMFFYLRLTDLARYATHAGHYL